MKEFINGLWMYLLDGIKLANPIIILCICGLMEGIKFLKLDKKLLGKVDCEQKKWLIQFGFSFLLSLILSFIFIEFQIKLFFQTAIASFSIAHFLYAGIKIIKPLQAVKKINIPQIIRKFIKKKLGVDNGK